MKKINLRFEANYFFSFYCLPIVHDDAIESERNVCLFQHFESGFLSKIETIGSHKIRYIQNPAAPTLFFVHGSPGSWDAFKSYLLNPLLLSTV